MRILSDITGKEYKTVEECLAAEKEFEAKVEAERIKKEKLIKEKETRLAAVKSAYESYVELRDAYCKDYKEPVHFTMKLKDKNTFDDIVNAFTFWDK